MTKAHRLPALITAVVILLAVASFSVDAAGRKATKDGDESFSTFVKYLKSNYHAKGQSTYGLVTMARFFVKVIKPAGVKNFKVSMLRDLQFTSLKVDDDLGSFIRKNVHTDWHPMTQVVSIKNRQYVYVYFMPEKNDVKFLVVAVHERDAFVVQFKFEPERLAQFIEKPEILGISLTGDDDKRHAAASDPGTASAASAAQTASGGEENKAAAGEESGKESVKADVQQDAKPESKPEAQKDDKKPAATEKVTPPATEKTEKQKTEKKKPPVLKRGDSETKSDS